MNEILDLVGQYGGVFKREEMLALFDFEHRGREPAALHGLCRISRPRREASGLNYLGVLILVDVGSEHGKKQTEEFLAQFSFARLSRNLAGLVKVIEAPLLDLNPKVRMREIDLVMRDSQGVGRDFVEEQVLPALCAAGGLQAEAPLWCELGGVETEQAESGTWLEDLKRWFLRR